MLLADLAADQAANHHATDRRQGAACAAAELIADDAAGDSADDRPALLIAASRAATPERKQQCSSRQNFNELHVFPVESKNASRQTRHPTSITPNRSERKDLQSGFFTTYYAAGNTSFARTPPLGACCKTKLP